MSKNYKEEWESLSPEEQEAFCEEYNCFHMETDSVGEMLEKVKKCISRKENKEEAGGNRLHLKDGTCVTFVYREVNGILQITIYEPEKVCPWQGEINTPPLRRKYATS